MALSQEKAIKLKEKLLSKEAVISAEVYENNGNGYYVGYTVKQYSRIQGRTIEKFKRATSMPLKV